MQDDGKIAGNDAAAVVVVAAAVGAVPVAEVAFGFNLVAIITGGV